MNSIIILSPLIYCTLLSELSSTQLESIYKAITPAIVVVQYSSEVTNTVTGEITKRDNLSMGLIVSPEGLVMVPGFVEVQNVQSFNFRVKRQFGDDEKEYGAIKLKKPDDINVVFLKIENKENEVFPYIRFTEDHQLKVGSKVALIGVLGESLDFARCVTTALVGAVIEKPRLTFCLDENVRLGFVGAPVINELGNVVGIVGFDLSKSEGGEVYTRSGHPLIYQYELFKKYINRPPEIQEEEQEAWLGVITQPLTDDLADYFGLPKEGGLIVGTILAGSPAEQAGLHIGDVITKFNGIHTRYKYDSEVNAFTKLVREAGAGKSVEIEVLRNGMPLTLKANLSARPKRSFEAEEFEWEATGITVRDLTPDLRILLSIDESVQGVFVYRVKSGSPAQVAKMGRGMVIQSVGNIPIHSVKDLKEIANRLETQRPKEITLFARIGNISGFFRLEPRWK